MIILSQKMNTISKNGIKNQITDRTDGNFKAYSQGINAGMVYLDNYIQRFIRNYMLWHN